MKIKDWFKLLRIEHSIKNLLIFAPLLFSKTITTNNILICILGFICFSLTASSAYILNDIADFEQDKKNNQKKDFPIQKGVIRKHKAFKISFMLLVLSNVLTHLIFNLHTLILLNTYFILNILYTLKVKNIPYLEFIFFIFFYNLRLTFGSLILQLDLSTEIVLFVTFSALYLITNKRINEKENNINKKSVEKYNIKKLHLLKNLFLILLLLIYAIWIFKHLSVLNIFSLLIVLFLLIRFEKNKLSDLVYFFSKDLINIFLITIYALLILGGNL